MPGTVVGMRTTEITKTRSLPQEPQNLVGEADRLRQLNLMIAVMEARQGQMEVRRRGCSLREGLAQEGGWSWPLQVSKEAPRGRMWEVWYAESVPRAKKPSAQTTVKQGGKFGKLERGLAGA